MSLALFIGLVIEIGVARILWTWAQALSNTQPYVAPAPLPDCDVCLTGAEVSAFLTSDDMCRTHRARWRLVHDLEAQVWGNNG